MSSTQQQEISTASVAKKTKLKMSEKKPVAPVEPVIVKPVGVTLEGLMAMGMDEAMAKSMLAHKEKEESSAVEEKKSAEEKDAFLKSSGWAAANARKEVEEAKMKAIEEANPQFFKKARAPNGTGATANATDEQRAAKKARALARKEKTAKGECVKCPKCEKTFISENAHYKKHLASH
jgi:hypothetical protein